MKPTPTSAPPTAIHSSHQRSAVFYIKDAGSFRHNTRQRSQLDDRSLAHQIINSAPSSSAQRRYSSAAQRLLSSAAPCSAVPWRALGWPAVWFGPVRCCSESCCAVQFCAVLVLCCVLVTLIFLNHDGNAPLAQLNPQLYITPFFI